MRGLSRDLTQRERAVYDALVARRAAREPLAYVIGRKEFWSLDFEVGPGALVPRPETETLIEQALKAFPDRAAPLRILDLGTGIGLPAGHGADALSERDRHRGRCLAGGAGLGRGAMPARHGVARPRPTGRRRLGRGTAARLRSGVRQPALSGRQPRWRGLAPELAVSRPRRAGRPVPTGWRPIGRWARSSRPCWRPTAGLSSRLAPGRRERPRAALAAGGLEILGRDARSIGYPPLPCGSARPLRACGARKKSWKARPGIVASGRVGKQEPPPGHMVTTGGPADRGGGRVRQAPVPAPKRKTSKDAQGLHAATERTCPWARRGMENAEFRTIKTQSR